MRKPFPMWYCYCILITILSLTFLRLPYFSKQMYGILTYYIHISFVFIHLFQIKYICHKYNHTKNHRSQWKSTISLRFITVSNLDESFKNVFHITIIIVSDKLHHVIIFLRWNVFAQLPEVLSNPTQILHKMYRCSCSLSQLKLETRRQANFLVTTYWCYRFGQLQSIQPNLCFQVMLSAAVAQKLQRSAYEIWRCFFV